MAYKGPDISAWQGDIDIKALASQVDFFIFRAYAGRSKDSKVDRNVKLAIESGKPYGLYIYSYALNTAQAKEEAQRMIALANSYSVKPAFLCIDMEDADGYKRKYGMPSNQTLKDICTVEGEAFENAGYYAMVYASSSWFNNQLKGLTRFDKWVAHWPVSGGKQKGMATSPDGENANNCGIWQFTSDGRLNGYNGRLDMNYAYKDFVLNKNGNTNPAPTPTPAPVPAQTSNNNTYTVKSGIDYFEYYVNGEKQKSNEITGLSQGSYTVYVIAYDKAGNPKQSEEQTIKMSRKIAKIAAGGFHSLAIDEEGNLWAWGANDKGQLGDGTTSRRLTPVPIMEGTKFKEIVATNHSLAIDEEGNLWAWGYNSDGQLGNGGSGNITVSKAPCQTEPVQIKSGTKFKKIAASNWHSLAIDEDGNLWVWGMNHIGQLGAGGTTDKTTPVQVMVGTKFKGIAAAAYDSLAIDEEGNLWGCGVNTEGELGDGTTTSRKSYIKIKSGTKFKEATMGEIRTSFTIDEGGNLWASGDNNYGTLGDGTTTDRKSPIQIKSGTFFKKVSAFDRHTLAIDEEGNLWVWGNIATNGLGDGTTTSRKSPVQIKSGTKFKEIAAGGVHSLAIDETGNLWAWGNGASGALGDGATSVRLTPVQIF